MENYTTAQKREINQLLDSIFKNGISMDKRKEKEAKDVMKSFLEECLLKEMKYQDKLFGAMYKRIFYTGSYYDGMKVGEPNEFDINVVLVVPKNFTILPATSYVPGYSLYESTAEPTDFGIAHLFEGYSKGKFYLMPELLMNWIQGVLRKSLNAILEKKTRNTSSYYIRDCEAFSRSGPAWTLHLQSKSGELLDVDFVPVFSFKDNEDDEVFLVPKPPEGEYAKRLWRLSFASKERKILSNLDANGQSCFKKITKLIKYLRDQQGAPLKKLCSFFIKNFMLLEMRNNPQIEWSNEKNLGSYFCDILKNFHAILKSGFMPSYFVDDFNILENLKKIRVAGSASPLENIVGRLGKIAKKINADPLKYIPKYFNVQCGRFEAQGFQGDNSDIEDEFSNLQLESLSPYRNRGNHSEYGYQNNSMSIEKKLVLSGAAVAGAGAVAYGLHRLWDGEREVERNDVPQNQNIEEKVLATAAGVIGIGALAYGLSKLWSNDEK